MSPMALLAYRLVRQNVRSRRKLTSDCQRGIRVLTLSGCFITPASGRVWPACRAARRPRGGVTHNAAYEQHCFGTTNSGRSYARRAHATRSCARSWMSPSGGSILGEQGQQTATTDDQISFFSPPGGTATDNVFRSATSKAMTLWRGVFTKLEYLILNHHAGAQSARARTHPCPATADRASRATMRALVRSPKREAPPPRYSQCCRVKAACRSCHLFDDVQLRPKPVGRAAGLARIHRTAIIPVTIAVTKRKTSIRPLASDTRAGPGQYPASPQPTPKITAPEIKGVSMAVEVGRLKRGDQSGRPRPNTRR
jgi:hypothetical protein